MDINKLMQAKRLSKYRLAMRSGVPYMTLSDICSGKTRLEKCSAETVYKLAKALAQKDYDKRLIVTLKKELKFLQNTLRSYRWLQKSVTSVAQIFEKLNKLRRPLIHPASLPTEDFVKLWQSVQYSGKPFSEDDYELYTSQK